MNIERAIKTYLVPEFKIFNEQEYLKLAKQDELNSIKTNEEHRKYIELMGKDIKIQIAYRKAMLPFVKKAQLVLIVSMTALITYSFFLAIPLAKKEYTEYKTNIAVQEKMKNEKLIEPVKKIEDRNNGLWCDKDTGIIYNNGNVVWRNGCKG